MLTETGVIQYLQSRKLITSECVVTDCIRISNVARRNENFHVTGLRGPDYFLKRGAHQVDVGSTANEAAAYLALQSPHASPELAPYLPRCFGYDAGAGVLILEAVPNAEDLQRYHSRTGRFPARLATDTGRALATLHNLVRDGSDGEHVRLKPVLPTVFRLRQPPLEILDAASGGCIELIRLVQRHLEFTEELNRLADHWRPETVIHGDLKLCNLLVRRRQSGRLVGVTLIDWEFAGLGDPLWDVGSVFSAYLALWLLSVPIAKPEQPDALLHLARFPLHRIQPAMGLFWNAYCETRQADESTRRLWVTRAMRCAAAVLVQTAYEHAKGSNDMTADITALMQLSLNMFKWPEQAAVQLLGLSD